MQNSPFLDKIATLRNRLPDWMEWTVGGVYIISVIIGGLFLSKIFAPLGEITAPVAAFMVALGSQVVRFLVVFFDQLNPQKPALNITRSYVAALVLGGFAIYEVVHLIDTSGLPFAAQISVGGLMFAGMVIEIYALRELQHATNYAFFSDPNKRSQLEQFYLNQAQFKAYVKDLKNQINTGAFAHTPAPTPPAAPPTPAPQPVKPGLSRTLLDAIGNGYKITPDQINEIWEAVKQNEPETEILKLVSSYSDLNRYHENQQKPKKVNRTNQTDGDSTHSKDIRDEYRSFFIEVVPILPAHVKEMYFNESEENFAYAYIAMAKITQEYTPPHIMKALEVLSKKNQKPGYELDFSKNGNG